MSKKGYKQTTEHKQKIGLANSIALKGKKQSLETIKNRALKLKGNKNVLGKHWFWSNEAKENFSKQRIGIVFSDEHKKNLSKTQFKKGQMSGKNNINWKGGITPLNHKIRNSQEYRQWHKEILKKDGYRCFDCGKKGGDLEVDHIYSFAKYPSLRFEILNGQTLCRFCHKQKTILERTGRIEVKDLID